MYFTVSLYYEEIGNKILKVGQPHLQQNILKKQQKHQVFESLSRSLRRSINLAFCEFMSLGLQLL